MKKFIRIGIMVVIALLFLGTFVFLYQKSQPKDVEYNLSKVVKSDIVQTTVATGKIDLEMKYKSSHRFRVSYQKSTRRPARTWRSNSQSQGYP